MRTILVLSALVLGVGASAAPPPLAPASKVEAPTAASPSVFKTAPKAEGDSRSNCRGRIVTARAERGLPKLPEEGAKAGDPLFIAAVDKMIDGCEVLVMRNDLSDIRPLPPFRDGAGKVIPLGG